VDAIPAGVDVVERVRHVRSESSVVVVLIGPAYLTVTDDSGRRRLYDDPHDLVRREVEIALEWR
jgi:hypothetical protein